MDSFLTFINQHQLDFKKDKSLLTVSGGVDSVVMSHLFYTMGFKAAIAHCNFSLRGQESDDDEQFVRELATSYGFDFFTKGFDTKAFASERSFSIQMAARELRYEWFENVRQANDCKWIATAHHASDSFETVLLNLTRGTGIAGLQGIAGINNALLRPMLYVTKAEILAYANDHNLTWREDRSNDSDDYKRNLIRHHAIPVFKKINPSLETTFRATSEKVKSANLLLDEFLEKWQSEVVEQNNDLIKINIKTLLSVTEPQYRLWFVLDKYGFAYSQVSQIMHSLSGIPGKTFSSPTHELLVDREALFIRKARSEKLDVSWTIDELVDAFTFEDQVLRFNVATENEYLENRSDHQTLVVDKDKLEFPLTIRNWRPGDKFNPFGMGGKSKKISDLLTDLKLNRFEKEQVRLLINGNGEVVWVIGIRSDERYRVAEGSDTLVVIYVHTLQWSADMP